MPLATKADRRALEPLYLGRNARVLATGLSYEQAHRMAADAPRPNLVTPEAEGGPYTVVQLLGTR